MKVYFISGLGADERVFKHIILPDGFEIIHLDWIAPLKNESLENYAMRMAEKIDTQDHFSLVGLSFGGMIATEIANHLSPLQTILISSVPSADYLPFYFKWAGKLGINKFIPLSILKNLSLAKRLFTTETSEDKEMLRKMIHHTDNAFLRWAMNAILHWKNKIIPSNLYHLHGTGDEVLPYRFTKPTHVLQKAGHMMILNRAGEINGILAGIVSGPPSTIRSMAVFN